MRYSFNTTYQDQFSYLIDNQKYIFKVTMFNPDGDTLVLTKPQIIDLKIYDNIFEPWTYGKISLDNTQQALERFRVTPTDLELQPDAVDAKGYTTRGDGRDFIKIEIIPIKNDEYQAGSKELDGVVGLRFFFNIENESHKFVDDKDIISYDITDYDYEILRERKSFFSSSNLVKDTNGKGLSNLSNYERSAYTGDCLKRILVDSLNDPAAVFREEGEEDSEPLTPFFESGISRIFYSSPAPNTALSDIVYIMDRHVSRSDKSDFTFLKKSPSTGEYTLEGAATKFEKAYNNKKNTGGPLFVENFTITGGGRETNNIIETEKKSPSGALEFGEKSEVIDFKFFNTFGKQYRDKIKSQIVHSYDFSNKKFNIDIFENNIVAGKEKFSENYVSKLKGKDNNPSPNLPTTAMQTLNLSFDNNFSEYSDPEIRKSYGINKLLKNALVTNMGIELIVKGQALRRSGTFFSIDRAGDYIDNTFDNKLLGIYFLVEVQHEFVNDNEYFNKIIGIKTYHYQDPKFREDLM